MRSLGTLWFAAAAGLLALGAFDPNCAGTNVTLGNPADDPEVPHRAPSRPPSPSTRPTATPLPPLPPVPTAVVANAPEPAASAAPAPEAPPTTAPLASPQAPAAPPSAGGPFEQLLGEPVVLAAPQCLSKGNHVRAVVPRPEDLDLSYRGAVPGIEIRRTVRAGAGGHRHARFVGGALEVDLWARGSGLVAGAVGFETCTGGAAADVSFEIVAHYLR